MLRQPIRDRAADDRPESWLVLATDRLRECNASIAAIDASGRPGFKPGSCRVLASAGEAEAWLADLRAAGKLDDARWTYTIFRFP